VTFRPTRQQAIGRGLYIGGLAGLITCGVLGILATVGLCRLLGAPDHLVPVLLFAPLPVGIVLGCLLGLAYCRHDGADVDELGIQRASGHVAWRSIADLRAERRGGRTRVAVYCHTGPTGWLEAPYTGRLLATDPEFERKLFMLRNALATHRNFARKPPMAPKLVQPDHLTPTG
jgi:hypothetical protein